MDSRLGKVHKCFDSHISHNIMVVSKVALTLDLCLIRDDYTVFNNFEITKEELVSLIIYLSTF